MSARVQKEIVESKTLLLQLSSLVEEAVRTAVMAFQKGDSTLADLVIQRDNDVDLLEEKIDSVVLTALALRQPMASDLRFLTSAQQIASQLERVGDHAVNIARQVKGLAETADTAAAQPSSELRSSSAIRDMANLAIQMLGESINAFVQQNAQLARSVRQKDSHVDDLYAQVKQEEIALIGQNRREVLSGVSNIMLAMNMERIADLATNIAEDVIFMLEGKLMRHDFEYDQSKGAGESASGASGSCPTKPGQVREPLECLERHAVQVHECLTKAIAGFRAYIAMDEAGFKQCFDDVSELEHGADLIKRNVRAHLPKGIIMPIDKFELFLYVNEQDGIADVCEDILEWLTYRRIKLPGAIAEDAVKLFEQCGNVVSGLSHIIQDAREYFKTGNDMVRTRVKEAILTLRSREHQADVMENSLKQQIFDTYPDDMFPIYFLVRLVELIGRTADQAESAADIMRSMIAR